MNTKHWIQGLIAAGRVPAIPIMTHPGIELLDRRVIDAVTDGQVHFEAIRRLCEHYPEAEAVTVIMDLTVEAEAFGAQLHTSDNEVPSVVGRLVADYDQVAALEVPSLDAGRVGEYLKANSLAASNLTKPVFGGCIGPYSLAGRLFDMTEIMMAIYTEPETARLLLDKCTAFILDYCRAIKATGVAGVIMAEPAAGLLSDEDCREYSSVYVRRIVRELQDDNFAVVLHNCGNTGHCTGAMIATGAAGYHLGNKVVMADEMPKFPADVLVMGNIDPVSVFKQASAEVVYRVTEELLEACGGYPNFVISSGCDTPPGVPFDNINAFYKAVKAYNGDL